MNQLTARIVILNYNGETLLQECLPSIVKAAEQSSYPTEITLLDNLSNDHGLDYVRATYPNVNIVMAKENRFLCSYNDFLSEMTEDIAILLNNDIRVDSNFVDPLVKPFEDDSLFLVAPQVMDYEGKRTEAGRSKAGIRFGLFWCDARYPGYEKDIATPSETYSSGFGAFSRKKFLELGGYDDRYLPGIMEDVDLCHRARLQGFKLLYEPTSICYHLGQATFKKRFGASGIAKMAYRNNFLFMWKNFRGLGFWLPHIVFVPLRLLFASLKGNFAMSSGFIQALKGRPS